MLVRFPAGTFSDKDSVYAKNLKAHKQLHQIVLSHGMMVRAGDDKNYMRSEGIMIWHSKKQKFIPIDMDIRDDHGAMPIEFSGTWHLMPKDENTIDPQTGKRYPPYIVQAAIVHFSDITPLEMTGQIMNEEAKELYNVWQVEYAGKKRRMFTKPQYNTLESFKDLKDIVINFTEDGLIDSYGEDVTNEDMEFDSVYVPPKQE